MKRNARVKQTTDHLLHLNDRLWKMDREIAKHEAFRLNFDRTNVRQRSEFDRLKAERIALREEREEIAWGLRETDL